MIFFQTIHDSGTFDELCQRQSITAESIFGDEYDADLVTGSGSDVDSPSDGQNSNPECERPPKGTNRPKLSKRQQSVIQYMRDQASIDDDPVAILSVSFCLNVFSKVSINTQNMTDPTIVSPVKMEYG